uniref:CW-type domain-containing protein n=1 Tax=Steinernema glaseri TaxID=37863 RepID=A0A1I7YJB4_9BILA
MVAGGSMTDHHRHSRPRMPPPAFLPSLASELKKSKLKKKVIDKTVSVESITATTKPNCSFAEKAKGTSDAGYFSVADRESPSSICNEQNNNESPKATTPQGSRKNSGSNGKPTKVKSDKKKSKKGFTISSLYQAAKKEEVKPPPITDIPIANNNNRASEDEQLATTPTDSVPDAWDEGIETPRSCSSPVRSDRDEEVYVEVDKVFPPEMDRNRYKELASSLHTAPRPKYAFMPEASTSTVGCMGCHVPIAPYSDDIWKYTPPHRVDCCRRFDKTNGRADSPHSHSQRMKQRERLRLIREEMERIIPSDPWKDSSDARLYNWCSEVNCKPLDAD